MTFANLIDELDRREGVNRYLDGLVYAALERRYSDHTADAYPAKREGMVVCRYTSGSTGTCIAPSYTRSLDAVLAQYRFRDVPVPDLISTNPRNAMARLLEELER